MLLNKFQIHLAVLALALCITSRTPADPVLWIESSSDLSQWTEHPIDPARIRDGGVRPEGLPTDHHFFRLKIMTATEAAWAKIRRFRDGLGIPLVPEDFADLGIDGVHVENINRVNQAILDAEAGFIGSATLLADVIENALAIPVEPRALAYAERVGLEETRIQRLSNFLYDLEEASIEPVWMVLGRAEFGARDGLTHRAVIGGDATVGGDVGNANIGIQFTGKNTESFVFPNPPELRSTESGPLGLWAVVRRNSAPNSLQAVISFNGGSTSRGPETILGDTLNEPLRNQASFSNYNTSTSTRRNSHAGFAPGIFSITGMQIQPQGDTFRLGIHKDIHEDSGLTVNPGTIWNNSTSGRVGARPSNSSRLNGDVSFAMITRGALNQAQRLTFYRSLRENGIASLNPPSVNVLVGDSMTAGASGAGSYLSRSCQLFIHRPSAWRGSFYQNIAVGGTGIDAQEGYYQSAVQVIESLENYPNRYIWFWGGYNTQVFNNGTDADIKEHADRYIAMAADAAERGIATVHWSMVVPGDQTRGSTLFGRIQLFNDYYKSRLALVPGKHIYYDHRETFSEDQFDGTARNEAYYSDNIHLTATGQEVLAADFLLKNPQP